MARRLHLHSGPWARPRRDGRPAWVPATPSGGRAARSGRRDARQPRAKGAARAGSADGAAGETKGADRDEARRIVARTRKALRLDDGVGVLACGGRGTHLGMDVSWSLTFDAGAQNGGAYWEGAEGEHMSYRWGFDGDDDVAAPTCAWEVDTYGLPIALSFDDKETGLLCAWVRTGYWTCAVESGRLDVHTDDVHGTRAALLAGEATGFDEGAAADAVRASLPPRRQVVSLRLPNGRVSAHVVVDDDTGLPSGLYMPVCGEMEAWLFDAWSCASDIVSSDDAPTIPIPRRTAHIVAGGASMHEFHAEWVRRDGGASSHEFAMPEREYPPAATTYENAEGAAGVADCGDDRSGAPYLDVVTSSPRGPAWLVEAQRTRSGHVLVRPLIDGHDVGWFILDTGASGLVLEPSAADELGLPGFGEVHVSGVGGKVPSQYRRAKELQLGPLTLRDPLFMEMSVERVVSGTHRPGRVCGILGFDVLQRVVVEVPPASRYKGGAGSGRSPSDLKLAVYEPEAFIQPSAEEATAVDMSMISNVPHVWCEVEPSAHDGDRVEECKIPPSLLMLDSGAGGVECMFHARAAVDLDLFGEQRAAAKAAALAVDDNGDKPAPVPAANAGGAASVRGVGGDSSSTMTVRRVVLPRLRLLTRHPNPDVLRLGASSGDACEDAGVPPSVAATVKPVSALVAGAGGALDLSCIGMGLLCGDAIAEQRVVFDYNEGKLWLLDEAAACPAL